jgi:hypothetical protein
MIYDTYFNSGDIGTDSVPTSEIESAVPERITDLVQGPRAVTNLDTPVTVLDSYINNAGYLVVKVDTEQDKLNAAEEAFVIDTVSGSVMDTLLDRDVFFADYSQNIKESEYTPTVFKDSYEICDSVMSLTEEQRDYVSDEYDVYNISVAVKRDIASDYIIHAEKPIGVEVRCNEDVGEAEFQKVRTRLPFDAEVYLTEQPSAPDIITIKYDDSLSDYMHWFSGEGDRIDTQHELSVVMNDILSHEYKYEFNEMNEGSLIYKVREGGYKRPW